MAEKFNPHTWKVTIVVKLSDGHERVYRCTVEDLRYLCGLLEVEGDKGTLLHYNVFCWGIKRSTYYLGVMEDFRHWKP